MYMKLINLIKSHTYAIITCRVYLVSNNRCKTLNSIKNIRTDIKYYGRSIEFTTQ